MKTVPEPQLSNNFWKHVDKTNSCWNWTGKPNSAGYGRCSIDGKRVYAHRASYELHKGEIGPGLEIDHTCHNRVCVNPEHLQVVTRKQNKENSNGAYQCNKSGVRGVTWDKPKGKWRAQVEHNGKTHFLGRFNNISDAEATVIKTRMQIFSNNLQDRVA